MYLLYLLLFLVAITILVDVIPQLYVWQSRIKIGHFINEEHWQKKVLNTTIKWLKNTPTITVTDNNRLILIDILKGNYKRKAIQHWQQAALLLGLVEFYTKTNDEELKDKIQCFLKTQFEESGSWKQTPTEIDSVILAYALIKIPFLDKQKYKIAFDSIYDLILNHKGTDATIAYKMHNKQFRYVDTIGFICPFLVEYGLSFQKPEAIELAVNQITRYDKYGMLNQSFIPCHTYNIETKIPTGLFGWGRGLGWYAIGLIDSWNALPENHSAKEILEKSVIQFAKTSLSFQNSNGSYHWLIMDKSSRIDSSATATLGWFFAVASQIKSIETECEWASKKSLEYLKSVTQRNGAIDFSQGDTKSIGVYSTQFSILPFTQGFCLRLIAQNKIVVNLLQK